MEKGENGNYQIFSFSHNVFISPLPAKLKKTLCLHSVPLSVHPSVCQSFSFSFPDFFPKCLQILTWFLAWKSISMFYRSRLSFIALHQFLAKLRALHLVNFRDQTVFWTFFLNACRYWPDFWHVELISIFYRSSVSFVKLHWFLAKLLALDLVNFSDQTVFRTFFLNTCRYWPDFWHESQSPCFTNRVRVSLPSIDFWQNYKPLT